MFQNGAINQFIIFLKCYNSPFFVVVVNLTHYSWNIWHRLLQVFFYSCCLPQNAFIYTHIYNSLEKHQNSIRILLALVLLHPSIENCVHKYVCCVSIIHSSRLKITFKITLLLLSLVFCCYAIGNSLPIAMCGFYGK